MKTKNQSEHLLLKTTLLWNVRAYLVNRVGKVTFGVIFLRVLHAKVVHLWDDDTLRSVNIWLKIFLSHLEGESGECSTCPWD